MAENLKKPIRSLKKLAEKGYLMEPTISELEKVSEQFSFGITPQMLDLIDKNNAKDPIAKQFIPSLDELKISFTEIQDPIGDNAFTKVKGIIHRYPDRCLFSPVHICPVYCRFCFRREKVGNSEETLNSTEMELAFQYIEKNSQIWEVILTGGDPLILKPQQLKEILNRLNTIKHVELIRVHSRIPLVDSQRINSLMLKTLNNSKPVFLILHVNHPKEFTQEAIKTINKLNRIGIPLLSQTVLLKNINDNIETLSALMKCCLKNRIKPYYLHHGDLTKGTQHFRTSIQKGQALMQQLRGRFSGLCQPTYVLDIPGGFGKVPIGPHYVEQQNESYQIKDYQGKLHSYKDDVKETAK